MLAAHCPISNATYVVPISMHCDGPISQPHPILSWPIEQLNRIGAPEKAKDYQLYIAAYLFQLGKQYNLVDFRATMPRGCVSNKWFYANIDTLQGLATWIKLNSSSSFIDAMPRFRVLQDTSCHEIGSWMQSIELIKSQVALMPTQDERALALLKHNLTRKWTEPTPSNIKKYASLAKARTKRDYLQDSFSKLPTEKIDMLVNIIFRPDKFEVQTLRDLKGVCHDLLLENTQDNWALKDSIIREIDQAIMDKVGISQLLDGHNPELPEDVAQKYRVEIADGVYISSTINTSLYTRQDIPSLDNIKPIATPTEEPKPEQYKNKLAYAIALRKYKEAQQ